MLTEERLKFMFAGISDAELRYMIANEARSKAISYDLQAVRGELNRRAKVSR